MSYHVEIATSAERDLKHLPRSIARRIGRRLRQLGDVPRPTGVKKLRVSPFYRLRVGDYRVIYEIHDREQRVVILHIRHRQEAYRR